MADINVGMSSNICKPSVENLAYLNGEAADLGITGDTIFSQINELKSKGNLTAAEKDSLFVLTKLGKNVDKRLDSFAKAIENQETCNYKSAVEAEYARN